MLKTKLVSEIMTRNTVSIAEEDNLHGLAELLDSQSFRQFPVVEKNRYVGMVTHRSLRHVLLAGASEQTTFVASIMRTDVPAVEPTMSVARVAEILVEQDLPALPVVDDQGDLVGIVSRHDILRVAIELLRA